ncbi:MAG: DUF1318 domain-containing protein [Verrucomicrobia bacterium]|nr:DUF1318 domain-containing protein [Verrucomicrobiota bacterium]
METKTLKYFGAAAAIALMAGCSAPTVNLATGEPIKVDIAMRLDVYSHNKEAAAKGAPASPTSDTETRRRNRMADIQNFKNSRLIGEGRDGLLSIQVDSPGEPGDYVRKTVAAENEDRMTLMKAAAEKGEKSLAAVQTEQGALWQKRSFEGELIEITNPDGTFSWAPKSGR